MRNLHEDEMEDSDDKERCGVCKSCFVLLTNLGWKQGEENRRVLKKDKGKAE